MFFKVKAECAPFILFLSFLLHGQHLNKIICALLFYIKMDYIGHWFWQTVAILRIHSLSGSIYNNYIHSTKVYIDLDPSNLSYPEALNIFSFMGNSTHERNILFIVCSFQYVFLSLIACSNTCPNSIPTPILLERSASLQKLWRAAGVVRGCQYQIGHKNHICSRLNHLHRLMGILTIIGLVPQGRGKGGGHRSPEAGEGTAGHWVLWL